MKIKVLVILLLVSGSSIFGQTVFNTRNDGLFIQNTLKKNALLISLKSGFHTAYEKSSDAGFNSGLIFGGDAEVGLTKNIYAGISYEFWNHTGEINNMNIETAERKSTGNNFSFNVFWKINYDDAAINLGIGAGSYDVSSEWKINKSKRTYLNIKFIMGLDVAVSKMFMVSTAIEYNAMHKFENSASMFSFKIGPTLVLNTIL